jgi:hypothetical protein
MEHDIGYTWEQLFGAVSSLATSSTSLRERLLDAVGSRVHRILNQPSKLPHEEIARRIVELEELLTKGGSFQETIDKMTDQEVYDTIDKIVSLFSMVARAYPEK